MPKKVARFYRLKIKEKYQMSLYQEAYILNLYVHTVQNLNNIGLILFESQVLNTSDGRTDGRTSSSI